MKTRKIAFMQEKVTLPVSKRKPLAIPEETYEKFKSFHEQFGPGQVWYTAHSVVLAGIKALEEEMTEEAA